MVTIALFTFITINCDVNLIPSTIQSASPGNHPIIRQAIPGHQHFQLGMHDKNGVPQNPCHPPVFCFRESFKMTTEPESNLNTSSDKLWNVLLHLSPIIGLGLIGPLVVYLVTKKDTGSSIPDHARETLNFHISMFLYVIVAAILCLVVIGIFLLFILAIASVVLAVIGAVKASDGIVYKYPLCIRLIS